MALSACAHYSARTMQHTRSAHDQVTGRLSRYLDRIMDGAAARIAPRVAERLDIRIDATLEALSDEEALDDLRASLEDDSLKDYDEIRRDAGLA
jgi:hypothetical protein